MKEEEGVLVFCDRIANVFYDSERREDFSMEEVVTVLVFLKWIVSYPCFFFLLKINSGRSRSFQTLLIVV